MIIKRNSNIKRKGRSNPRRNGFSRYSNFENKPKGNASKILERYLSLARDASSNGDKIKAEGFYQYAEHYQRVINAQPIKNGTKKDDSDEQDMRNNLSRTERAENAKIKRFNNSNIPNPNDKKQETSNIEYGDKTADGVEALKAFNTSMDENKHGDK